MKRLLLFFGIAVLLLGANSAVWADSCTGTCGTDTANGDVTNPPGFSSYSYVTTDGGPEAVGTLPSVFGSAGVTSTNGSTFTTSPFAATAGESINFDFNFVTSDGSSEFPDYAWAALMSTDGGSNYLIFSAQTQPTGNTVPGQTLPPLAAGTALTPATSAILIGSGLGGGPVWSELGSYSGDCYDAGCGLTGWITSQFTGEAADTYVLEFGVSNASDTAFDTGMAFAGIEVGGAPIGGGEGGGTQVPEPSSLLMLGLGLAGVVALRKKRVATSTTLA
jgi:hypothetical protein